MTSIKTKAEKADSTHQDYVLINNDLSSPLFYTSYLMHEPDRILVTKYRSGTHYLKILTGNRTNTPRERRLCKCNEVQTLHHVIFECIHTNCIRSSSFTANIATLKDFFGQDVSVVATSLRLIEKHLKLR